MSRKVGSLVVPPVGLGLMVFANFYAENMSEEAAHNLLTYAADHGITHWDTSSAYGDSELIIGRWFTKTGRRKDIVLASKFAFVGLMTIDSSPEHAISSCAKSLERLQTNYIDLFYVHRIDDVTPIEKTMEALSQLKKEGKILEIGLSETSANTLERANAIDHVAAYQIEYSPFSLDIEHNGVLAACRKHNTAIIAYSPIGRGLLNGKIRSPDDLEGNDFRRGMPRFSAENFPKNLELVDKIHALAKKKGVEATQLTLAWILAQGPDFIPIPGTSRTANLQSNIDASKIQLTKEELAEIRHLAENADVQGNRYMDSFEGFSFRESVPL